MAVSRLKTSAAVLTLVVGLVSCSASAQQRWDHRGSLGLTTAFGVDGRSAIGVAQSDNGVRLFPELGATLSVSDRWNVMLAGRLSLLGPTLGLSFIGGVRSTYGQRFKTFFDLNLAVHAVPIFTIGPRFAFGVQYELLDVIGAFASAGVQFGVGPAGARFAAEVVVGLQFRTYLFE
jgi:hypothetical protein